MVEDGKLSVDEALTLLEELEKASKTAEEKQEAIVKDLSTAVHFEEAKKELHDEAEENFGSKNRLN